MIVKPRISGLGVHSLAQLTGRISARISERQRELRDESLARRRPVSRPTADRASDPGRPSGELPDTPSSP